MKIRVAFIIALLGYVNLIEARIGTFWHVSDFHLDRNYSTDGDTSSMCWKTVRSSIRGRPAQGISNGSPGRYGDYLCDAPLALVQSAISAMKDIEPYPDFIMWTGDDTAHIDDKYLPTEEVVSIISQITDELKGAFTGITFLPVLGNHDYYPKNQLPPGESPLQTQVANLWSTWLRNLQYSDMDAYSSFKKHGRYFVKIKDTSIWVMAFNTLIWYKNNNETALDDTADDPDSQFEWADRELYNLNNGEKVFLIGHIPPGSFERYQQKTEGFHWYQERYNKRFIKLIQDHSDVIAAQFFAHHHTDSFRLFYGNDNRDSNANPISFQLLVPGVTPWKSSLSEETGANNPGIRLVSYDTDTGKLTDVSTYYLDLDEANKFNDANWKLEYNFNSYYALKEVSASSLHDLTERFQTNSIMFDKYYLANTVNYEDPSVCTSKCKKLHRCSITEVDYDRFKECNSGSTIIPWTMPLLLVITQAIWMTC